MATTMKLKIEGMRCEHCVGHVKKALEGLAGVTVHAVSIGLAELEVVTGKARSAAVAAIEDEGYRVVGGT